MTLKQLKKVLNPARIDVTIFNGSEVVDTIFLRFPEHGEECEWNRYWKAMRTINNYGKCEVTTVDAYSDGTLIIFCDA